jgi:sulfur carrier protein
MTALIPSLNITTNGQPRSVAVGTLLVALVRELCGGSDRPGVAAAVNGEIVRRAEWATHLLAEGDEVEIVTATQGG